MADRAPLGYPLIPGGVVILDGRSGASLRSMVDPWLRQLRVDGYRLSDEDQVLIRCLDELSKLYRGIALTSMAEPLVWLTTADAAARAGTTAQAVRDAARLGTIRYRRVGRMIEVSESSLGSWIEQRNERLAKLRKGSQTTQRRRSA